MCSLLQLHSARAGNTSSYKCTLDVTRRHRHVCSNIGCLVRYIVTLRLVHITHTRYYTCTYDTVLLVGTVLRLRNPRVNAPVDTTGGGYHSLQYQGSRHLTHVQANTRMEPMLEPMPDLTPEPRLEPTHYLASSEPTPANTTPQSHLYWDQYRS